MENNLKAQTLHQSYKTPAPVPTRTASGKPWSAPLSSASAKKPENKVSCIHSGVIIITYISTQQRAGQTFTLKQSSHQKKLRWCILNPKYHKVQLYNQLQYDD